MRCCAGVMHRRMRILAFQYSVTVGTSVMLTEEAVCVHIFLLLLLASIGYCLYAQWPPSGQQHCRLDYPGQ